MRNTQSNRSKASEVFLGMGALAAGVSLLFFFAFRIDRQLAVHGVETKGVVKARYQVVKEGSTPVQMGSVGVDGDAYEINLLAKRGEITVEFLDKDGGIHTKNVSTSTFELLEYPEGSRMSITYLPEDPEAMLRTSELRKWGKDAGLEESSVAGAFALLLFGIGVILAVLRRRAETPLRAELVE